MSKRLQAIGNSKGLIIDQPLLDLLGITSETELDIRAEGKCLIVTPIERERRRTGRVARVQPQAKIPQRNAATFGRIPK